MTDPALIRHRKHVADGASPVKDCHYCDIEHARLVRELDGRMPPWIHPKG
jgi:hypothetical protein